MHSPTSASASAQFLPTSKVSQAQNSKWRSRMSAAARRRRSARSSTGVRRPGGEGGLGGVRWRVRACSVAASGWMPMTCAGRAGLVEANVFGGADALAADDEVVLAAELGGDVGEGVGHAALVVGGGEVGEGFVVEEEDSW